MRPQLWPELKRQLLGYTPYPVNQPKAKQKQQQGQTRTQAQSRLERASVQNKGTWQVPHVLELMGHGLDKDSHTNSHFQQHMTGVSIEPIAGQRPHLNSIRIISPTPNRNMPLSAHPAAGAHFKLRASRGAYPPPLNPTPNRKDVRMLTTTHKWLTQRTHKATSTRPRHRHQQGELHNKRKYCTSLLPA